MALLIRKIKVRILTPKIIIVMSKISCKHCKSSKLVKYGFSKNNSQRYKCKECLRPFVIGDKREKYSMEKKEKVIKMYLEGVGIILF